MKSYNVNMLWHYIYTHANPAMINCDVMFVFAFQSYSNTKCYLPRELMVQVTHVSVLLYFVNIITQSMLTPDGNINVKLLHHFPSEFVMFCFV